MKRKEAHAAGQVTYIADKPCRYGHMPTIRYTSTGNCRDCLHGNTTQYASRIFRLRVPVDKVDVFKQMCAALSIPVDAEALAAASPPPAAPRPPVESPFAAEIARVKALYPDMVSPAPAPVHSYPPLPPGPSL